MPTSLPPGYAVTPPDTTGAVGNPGPAATGTQYKGSNSETSGTKDGSFSSGTHVETPGPPVAGGTVGTDGASGGNTASATAVIGPYSGGAPDTQVAGPPGAGINAGGFAYRAPAGAVAATTTDTTRTAQESASGFSGAYGPVLDSAQPLPASYTLTVADTRGDSGGIGPGNVAVPAAPTGVTALPRVSGARVSWTDGANTGLPIKGYRVYVYPSHVVDADVAAGQPYISTQFVNVGVTSVLVDRLTAGQALISGVAGTLSYKFAVAAVNQSGDGPRSLLSAAVTPFLDNGKDLNIPAALNAPTGVTAVGTPTGFTVSWTRPTQDGGFDISFYTVQGADSDAPIYVRAPRNGTSIYAEPPTSVIIPEDAGEADSYTVTATTVRPGGTLLTSPASTASGSATSNTVPGAPTIGAASQNGANHINVAFTAPVSNGGSAITGYTATSTPGGFTATGPSSPLNVAGLTTGVAYTFTVHATNAVGNSPESAASNSVTSL